MTGWDAFPVLFLGDALGLVDGDGEPEPDRPGRPAVEAARAVGGADRGVDPAGPGVEVEEGPTGVSRG